ncbi:hypothetical protein MAR_033535, partial [Mya arenaria]
MVEEMNAQWNISVDSSFLPYVETSQFELKLPKQTEIPPPHLEPVVVEKMIFGAEIDFMTSKDRDNSSVCYKECQCPCSWVKPNTYTERELKEKVKKLQQKLIRNKNETSSWVRK